MSHIFSFPNALAPTTLVLLHPAYVVIQEEELVPVQRLLTTADGTQWVFALSGHVLQTYTVLVTELDEADRGGFAGYQTLKAFFATVTNWSMAPFALTHTDGGTVMVRLPPSPWRFTEERKGQFSGQFPLHRLV